MATQRWETIIIPSLSGSMFRLFSNSARRIHNFGTEIRPADLGFGEKVISIQYCATGLDSYGGSPF